MSSGSGNSSGSSQTPYSGSDEALMDQRKRKRKESNRKSAKRSRVRKQQHLDELMAQVSQLKKQNELLLATLSIRNQQYIGVEAENSVLWTQTIELSSRLQSLNDMLHCMNAISPTNNNGFFYNGPQLNDSFTNPWDMAFTNQPIMASMDVFQY